MNGTVCEELGLELEDVEPTEQNLTDYHPEEDEQALEDARAIYFGSIGL